MDRETLIGKVYEAASLPELWPSALEALGTAVGTPNALLGIRRSDDWAGAALSPSMEVPTTDYLASDVPARTEITARLIAADHPGFLRSGDVFTPEEWEADPFRNEWARKWGFNHGIATAVQTLSEETLVFHVQRLEGEPAFNRREVALLDSLRPHLARAGLLAARLRLERLRAAAEALGVIGLPSAILDHRGRVLAANPLVQTLTHHVRWLSKDRLGFVDDTAAAMLAAACHQLGASTPPETGSFVSRPSEAHVAVCYVIPTVGQARDIFAGSSAILVISPVTAKPGPSTGLIQSLFDLTPTEALVARGIAQGLSVPELAAGRRISVNTVRTQVKAVLAKMGATRQSQVAAVLAQVGAVTDADPSRQG